MSCSFEFVPQLRARGFRMTSQRHIILHVLCHSGKHLSPTQVYKKARVDLPNLTETTVYRTLDFLVQNGLAHQAQNKKGHLSYEFASRDHHHLKCTNCSRDVEISHSMLKDTYKKIESTSGYKLTGNHNTFIGLCPDCQKGK